MKGYDESTAERRALRFLAPGEVRIVASTRRDRVLLHGGERGAIALAPETLTALARSGAIERSGDTVKLRPEGESARRRIGGGAEMFAGQHRDTEIVRIRLPDGTAGPAAINLNESPLAQLARRKASNGAAFLSEVELRAGERLRVDYTRASIMPRLSANWVASVSSGKRSASQGGVELTDAILAARQRVERALNAVGPELSGILIDVCCFLKGMGTVETERRWPARSAKIVLKAALSALGRHYEPERGSCRMSHNWGADGFRPAVGG